jgi:hypothetical protein
MTMGDSICVTRDDLIIQVQVTVQFDLEKVSFFDVETEKVIR